MTDLTIVWREGRPEYAVVPCAEYARLCERAGIDPPDTEDAADIAAADGAGRRRAVEARAVRRVELRYGGVVAPFVPFEVTKRILAGATPLKAWREHIRVTQEELARRTGLSRGYVAQLEAGTRAGMPDVLARLARALGILVDDLVPDGAAPAAAHAD